MVEMRTNLRALSSLVVLFNFVHADGHNPMSAPAAGEVVEAEKPYTIEWDPGTPGPVSINLHFGDTSAVPIVGECSPTNIDGCRWKKEANTRLR